MAAGQERIIARVHDQRGHGDIAQVGFTARARPVIVGVAETVQRRRHYIIEVAQRARVAHDVRIIKGRKAFQLLQAFFLQRLQEMAAVQSVDARAEQVAGC